MDLNNFIWENFKQTPGYENQRKTITSFFDNLKSGNIEKLVNFINEDHELIRFFVDEDNYDEYMLALNEFTLLRQKIQDPRTFYEEALGFVFIYSNDDDDGDSDSAEEEEEEEEEEGTNAGDTNEDKKTEQVTGNDNNTEETENEEDQENREYSEPMVYYNTIYDFMYLFSAIDPENFFIFNFERETQHLKAIFDEFNLGFPKIPKKRNHTARMMFYFDLCQAAKEVKNYIDCDGIDINILFNDFGKKAVPRTKPPMGEPTNAYFIGGGIGAQGVDGVGDFEDLDQINDETEFNWQGNAFARPGDIFVMYCLSPRSCIHSIWQATDFGFVDPFFYFYNNTYIGKPKLVPPITIKELKADEVMGQVPLVRGSMQGINGVRIEKKTYDRLLELLELKGFSTKDLPQLPTVSYSFDHLKDEREVEIELIEPLLNRLQFNTQEYSRQLHVKIGRSEKVIPDYLCRPSFVNNDWSCYWIWESKYSIDNPKAVERDFLQAKSYAMRLAAKGLSLASKEGVWVTKDFSSVEKLRFFSWKDLEDGTHFDSLFKIAGNHK